MIFQKLFTLSRATTREAVEVVVDANAIRIFEQEIIDCENAVQKRRRDLSELIATRKQIERDISSLQHMVKKREQQAEQVVNTDSTEENLLRELAEDIAGHEQEQEVLQRQLRQLQQRETKLETSLRKALSDLNRYRRDLRLAKTAVNTRQQTRILQPQNNLLSEQLSNLNNTRQHVLSLQQWAEDKEAAYEEVEDRLDHNPLEKQLSKAGIDDTEERVNKVLERLKNK